MNRLAKVAILVATAVAGGIAGSMLTRSTADYKRQVILKEFSDRLRYRHEPAEMREHLAHTMKAAIEIERLDSRTPAWAGTYSEGDGLGVNISVIVAPACGYVYEWYGCLGCYERSIGMIDVSNETIFVRPEYSSPDVAGLRASYRIGRDTVGWYLDPISTAMTNISIGGSRLRRQDE